MTTQQGFLSCIGKKIRWRNKTTGRMNTGVVSGVQNMLPLFPLKEPQFVVYRGNGKNTECVHVNVDDAEVA